ncbi:MAG: phage tail tape measure protein [Acidobacteriia bacterium]|nr:phage tail tape measure protein [Terriglobia bacterium]
MNDAKNLTFGSAKEMERSLKIIGTAAATAFPAAAAAAGLLAKQTIDLAQRLGEMAQQTGASVEFLDKLRQIGNRSGVEIEGFAKGLTFLARAMVEAAAGARQPLEAFRALGVSFVDANGRLRPVEATARDVIKALGDMADGAAKADIMKRLFGKAGAELTAGFNEAAKSIDGLNAKITTDFAKASQQFNAHLVDLKTNLGGLVAVVSGPVVTAFNEAFVAAEHFFRSNETRAREAATKVLATLYAPPLPPVQAAMFAAGEATANRLKAEAMLTSMEALAAAQKKLQDKFRTQWCFLARPVSITVPMLKTR